MNLNAARASAATGVFNLTEIMLASNDVLTKGSQCINYLVEFQRFCTIACELQAADGVAIDTNTLLLLSRHCG